MHTAFAPAQIATNLFIRDLFTRSTGAKKKVHSGSRPLAKRPNQILRKIIAHFKQAIIALVFGYKSIKSTPIMPLAATHRCTK